MNLQNLKRAIGFVVCWSVIFTAATVQAQEASLSGEWIAVDGQMYGVTIPAETLPLLRFSFDSKMGKWTLPGYPQNFRYTVYGENTPDSLDFHLSVKKPQKWLIPVNTQLHEDTLSLAFHLAQPFDPDQSAPPARPNRIHKEESKKFLNLSLVRSSEVTYTAPKLPNKNWKAAEAVEKKSIESMTRALTAPEMEGRESGQPGGKRAARTIAKWFHEAGLKALGDDGYLQQVPLISGRAEPSSTLTIDDTTFHVGREFALASLPMRTRPAMNHDTEGEIYLFGPSLGPARADAPLPKLDVEGKIVAWIASSSPSGSGADILRTYEALHRNGAEMIIALFPGPMPESVLRSPIFSGIGALDAKLYDSRPARPLILLGQQAFQKLFGDGSEIRTFMKEFKAGEHLVQPTGKEVAISYKIEETTSAPTYNIVGVIRGGDPELRDEAVVYTAHYDAFGIHDDAVYQGAADNALGVAEMIEIANAIKESNVQPRRSIVFLAVGAEERGMLGTLHWTRHPMWPLENVVANINMDGGDTEAWGPLHGVIDLTRHATLGNTAAEIGAAMGLPVLPNDGVAGGSSDFYDFLRAGIPAIQLMGIGGDPSLTQMRLQRYGSQRVHKPGDVIYEKWDWTGPREMAQFYLLLGLRVANTNDPPSMRVGSPYAKTGEYNDQ